MLGEIAQHLFLDRWKLVNLVILDFCVTAARGLAISLHFEPFPFLKWRNPWAPETNSEFPAKWMVEDDCFLLGWLRYLAGASC